MQRFFGTSKKAEPPPSLSEATTRIDNRVGDLDDKIKKLDGELRTIRDQLKRTRPGPAQNSLKQRALRCMKQKKMYEQQREQLMGQAFNMQQTEFLTQNLQDTITTVAVLQNANKNMKQQFKQIDIDSVEDLYDEMSEIIDQSNQVQEALSRAYSVPDDFDEADLDAELDALGDELELEDGDATPAFLMPQSESFTMPAAPSYDPAQAQPHATAAQPLGQQAAPF